ncbi:hypothetical protein E4U14_004030 [Claviceps sp. LM454 group G7]|nr:hypothetical protein E4U14_004030 [Claviceps sp. LM454 group G7]
MITPSTEELRMYVDSIPHREQVGSHSVSSGGERATGVKADTREPNGLDDNNLYKAESYHPQVTTLRKPSPVPSGWRGTPPARINPKHLAAFSKAQQLDSDLALNELSHVDAVPVSRIAEKGVDIEHALANGSSPYHEEG